LNCGFELSCRAWRGPTREALYGLTGSVGEFGEHVHIDLAKLEASAGSRLRRPTAEPRVSIGVPVYNGARYLAATLTSLVGQTYEDIEIVISDNGSTDETGQICRDLVARDRRVRYVRHDTNRGLALNYNGLVSETSGPYFKMGRARRPDRANIRRAVRRGPRRVARACLPRLFKDSHHRRERRLRSPLRRRP
jgi:hypothetical protein